MPFVVGSTTVNAMAVASAALTAFPPASRIDIPAWAASGCDVRTARRPIIDVRLSG